MVPSWLFWGISQMDGIWMSGLRLKSCVYLTILCIVLSALAYQRCTLAQVPIGPGGNHNSITSQIGASGPLTGLLNNVVILGVDNRRRVEAGDFGIRTVGKLRTPDPDFPGEYEFGATGILIVDCQHLLTNLHVLSLNWDSLGAVPEFVIGRDYRFWLGESVLNLDFDNFVTFRLPQDLYALGINGLSTDDWAIIRLPAPVSDCVPALPVELRENAVEQYPDTDYIFVASERRSMHLFTIRSPQCRIQRDFFRLQRLIYEHNCDAEDGSSGGAIYGDVGGEMRLLAIHVGNLNLAEDPNATFHTPTRRLPDDGTSDNYALPFSDFLGDAVFSITDGLD